MDKPTVSIVIPYYNGWSMTHSLLYSLYHYDGNNISEVMLVDDASDDSAVVGGEKWWKENGLLPVRVFRFDENQGFLKSANKGLQKSDREIKILISNDVTIHDSFVEYVCFLLTENPNQLIGNVYHIGNTGWNKFGDTIYPYLAGHFICATKEIWEQLGYFDERYCPSCFEDIDLSTQARTLGIQLTSLSLPTIGHLGGATIKYTPERNELTKRNQEKFRQKWIG